MLFPRRPEPEDKGDRSVSGIEDVVLIVKLADKHENLGMLGPLSPEGTGADPQVA